MDHPACLLITHVVFTKVAQVAQSCFFDCDVEKWISDRE